MINMETIIKARRLHHQGLSVRQIAKQLNINRRTVTKYIELETLKPQQGYQRNKQHYPALGAFIEQLNQQLQQQLLLPINQRRSAWQHYEHLQSIGFTGSYSAVRRFVATFYKQQPPTVTIDAFIPLDFDPGEAYQFDWSTETVKLGGKLCKVQLAQFRLCYSRAFFLYCYSNQTTEMFVDAHNRAFEFFGGTARRGIYDNLKTAVTKVLKGKERVLNENFCCMMDHFDIEPVPCSPGAGWEKGQVERQVSTYRKRFFEPVLSFSTIEELNGYLTEQCVNDMAKRKHPQYKQQTVAEVFQQEQQSFLSERHCTPYPYYRVVQAAVNSYCLVHFEGNRYSIPCHLVKQQLSLHVYLDRIQMVHAQTVVAEHKRIYDKGQTCYQPQHYLPLLKRKPGALRNGEPFKQWHLPPAIRTLQQHLMRQKSGDRAMVEMLSLLAEYGEEVGVAAAELALECGMPTVAAVQNIIHRLNEPSVPKFNLPDIPLRIAPQADLLRYNTVLKLTNTEHPTT